VKGIKNKAAVFGTGPEQANGIKNLKKYFIVYGFEDNKKIFDQKRVDISVNIRLRNKKKILEYLKKKKINFLFSFCSERTLPILSYLYLKLNKENNYAKLIKRSLNKYSLRKVFLKKGIPTPKFSILENQKQIKIKKIIKPFTGSGSKGIVAINKNNFSKLKIKNFKNCLIEDYIDGDIYAIDGYCVKKLFFGLSLSKKLRDINSPLVDKKIIFNHQNKNLLNKANILGQKCCAALDVENVPIHLEFIRSKEGILYPIDFAIRGAGACLFNFCLSELISKDASDCQIKLQMNKSIQLNVKRKVFFYIYFLTAKKKSFMKRIDLSFFRKINLKHKIYYNKKIGEKISSPMSTHDRAGHIYFKFYSYSKMLKNIKIIDNYLDNLEI